MLNTLKRHVQRICTPDQIDLEEHYQSRAEHTADLVVHVVGLTLAAVGGLVLAIMSAFYAGFGCRRHRTGQASHRSAGGGSDPPDGHGSGPVGAGSPAGRQDSAHDRSSRHGRRAVGSR